AWPDVGSVMGERSLSRVLLPAPFRPMMPMTSPTRTSKETSRSAQKTRCAAAGWSRAPRSRCHADRAPAARDSRRDPNRVGWASEYCLLRRSTRMAMSVMLGRSDDVRESALDPAEVTQAAQQQPDDHERGDG